MLKLVIAFCYNCMFISIWIWIKYTTNTSKFTIYRNSISINANTTKHIQYKAQIYRLPPPSFRPAPQSRLRHNVNKISPVASGAHVEGVRLIYVSRCLAPRSLTLCVKKGLCPRPLRRGRLLRQPPKGTTGKKMLSSVLVEGGWRAAPQKVTGSECAVSSFVCFPSFRFLYLCCRKVKLVVFWLYETRYKEIMVVFIGVTLSTKMENKNFNCRSLMD